MKTTWLARSVDRPTVRRLLNSFVQAVLEMAVLLGRWLTRWRMSRAKPRSMWGVTPILTLPLLSRCDQILGIRSESVVFTTYHTSKSFDINFGKILDLSLKYAPSLYPLVNRLILAWAVRRYDIVHYFYDRGILVPVDSRSGFNPEELEILKRSGKQLFCYAYGADVRTRDATRRLGKWNYCISCPDPMKYCQCDDTLGGANMSNISKYARAMVSMGDMLTYVPGARNQYYWPIDLTKIPFVGVTRVEKGAPLRIAHVPNHSIFKGTRYLEAAVSKLVDEGFQIELMQATLVPNETVLEIYSQADIVADQFIAGFHGYAAMEAMALGKPVLIYIRSPDMVELAEECPFINVTPDAIEDALRWCVTHRDELAAIGLQGRRYIERWHSIDGVAERLALMYEETAEFTQPKLAMIQEVSKRLSSNRGSIATNRQWHHPFMLSETFVQ